MRRAVARARFVLAGAMVLVLTSGCARWLAREIAQPPLSQVPRIDGRSVWSRLAVPLERLEAAPGPAIAYRVIEPGDYRLDYVYRADPGLWAVDLRFESRQGPPTPVRGTVLVLHGWSLDMASTLPFGLALAERGYRVVLMDLRNHGRSGRAPAGFGAREATDVRALLAALHASDRIEPPLALVGVSLGAVVALHVAAADDGIAAVLALEPFANAGAAVHSAARGLAGIATMRAATERFASPARLRATAEALERRLDLDLDALDTTVPLAAARACVALVHGQRDRLIPVESTRSMGSGQANVQRIELPWDGHFSTPARLDLLADPTARWFDAVDADTPCPRLPVYPLTPTNGVRIVLPRPRD